MCLQYIYSVKHCYVSISWCVEEGGIFGMYVWVLITKQQKFYARLITQVDPHTLHSKFLLEPGTCRVLGEGPQLHAMGGMGAV